MARLDYDITAAVRRVLVQHSLELSDLTISTIGGAVYLSGRVRHAGDQAADMDTEEMCQLDLDLRSLKDVKRVTYNLENWDLDYRDVWRRVGQAPQAQDLTP